jgi:ATP synthase I chain
VLLNYVLGSALDNHPNARVELRALRMPEDDNSGPKRVDSPESGNKLTRRLLHVMTVVVGIGVGVSLPLTTWRVTTGLLLGGVLSLLNFHWMRSSVSNAFGVLAGGEKPKIGLMRYVLRYLIIGIVVYAAYVANIVSLPATFIGLSSFVVALFVEALRESYFILTHREGTN